MIIFAGLFLPNMSYSAVMMLVPVIVFLPGMAAGGIMMVTDFPVAIVTFPATVSVFPATVSVFPVTVARMLLMATGAPVMFCLSPAAAYAV